MKEFWGFSKLDSTGFAFRVSLKPSRGKYKELKSKYLNAQPIDSMRYLDLIKINLWQSQLALAGMILIQIFREIIGLPVFDDNNEFSVAVFMIRKATDNFTLVKRLMVNGEWQKIKGLYNKKVVYADPFILLQSGVHYLYIIQQEKKVEAGGYDIYACNLNGEGEWDSDIIVPNVNIFLMTVFLFI